jgi:tryptophan synthase alpha chain
MCGPAGDSRPSLFQQLDTVFLAAPTSSEERLKLICQVSSGFVYLIARMGVTGKKTQFDESLSQSVRRIRRWTELPIGVGFGIRSREDVARVWQYADAAIVGSAIVQFIDENQTSKKLASKVSEYVRDQLMPAS